MAVTPRSLLLLLVVFGIASSLELEFPETFEDLRELHEKREAFDDFTLLEAELKRRQNSGESEEAGSCNVNGKTYKNGESYKIACNTCHCVNGASACTLMACPGCTHNGVYYAPSDSFKLSRNTTCTCLGRDRIGCRVMPDVCYYQGRFYRPQTKFNKYRTRPRDCNKCGCLPGNLVLCSRVDCSNQNAGCVHKGRKYDNGQKWVDGCNVCTCALDFMYCTEMKCI